VTGGSNERVSVAALIAIKPGQHPRLIYRVHQNRRHRGEDQRKGFTETDYAALLDAAHQRLAGPLRPGRAGKARRCAAEVDGQQRTLYRRSPYHLHAFCIAPANARVPVL
jgi:hypothetical protein